MRSDTEIIARIEARRGDDIFGFEWPYYMMCLPFELAKPYLNPDTVEVDTLPRDHAFLRQECINYMDFAWEKANNFRSISAVRSIMHYVAWLWLLGEDAWGDKLLDEYDFYGKPQLVKICQFLGLDPNKWDDGVRMNEEPAIMQIDISYRRGYSRAHMRKILREAKQHKH